MLDIISLYFTFENTRGYYYIMENAKVELIILSEGYKNMKAALIKLFDLEETVKNQQSYITSQEEEILKLDRKISGLKKAHDNEVYELNKLNDKWERDYCYVADMLNKLNNLT